MKQVLAIVGPTASGKTALSLNIAQKYNAEIISCDSMQLYRGMNIGTAKPTKSEMNGIVHHMIDVIDIKDNFSVSDYVDRANQVYDDIVSRGKTALLCGGTGLYLDSFISGVDFGEYEIDAHVTQQLTKELNEYGMQFMYDKLVSVDETAALKTCPQNTKRVLRALQVFYSTGITLTEWNKRSMINAKPKDALVIGLDYKDRDVLYSRIDKRVDIMVNSGLIEETKALIDSGIRNSQTASQAIGYKEFYPYFDGQASLEECVEVLKRNSRRYAKRQLTWFRRNPKIKWIYKDALSDEEIALCAHEIIESFISEEQN